MAMANAERSGRVFGIGASIRELGLTNYLCYALDRLAGTLRLPVRIIRYLFVAQPVAAGPHLPERRGRNIEISLASRGNAALADLPLDDEVLAFRFEQGAICFVARQDGKTIGCLWLAFDTFREDEVDCLYRMDANDAAAWDFDVYVAPEARTGLAFLKLWDSANAFMRERGIGWSISRISAHNTGSLKVHEKMGIQQIGSATFVRFGGVQLFLSRLKPYVYLSTRSGRPPCVTLRPKADNLP